MATTTFKGLGRRKSSTAIVKLTPGSGKLIINNRKAEEYFPNKIVIQDMRQPLELTKTSELYDINVVVSGGGFTGQAGAIRLGIARALVSMNPDLKKQLKQHKLVTRDARVKERKKFGLYGARRAPQFTKR
ncbi:30S ribosomal protein S9 [Mycoplasma bradburyae]|uniref:Small ribosomal subunit protein uS9 n=1 Tax=Mycoplasma bradburyae TaxID=2963128 RepID=A0AAW6HQL4_9MOLU|nr:30S ribosomal protein S9 [Mycoplasma bradburyae]MDC4163334.1 30S ribosomal protein S9 [Mycoplasma bradburyae]MDC4181948.1 30S ribosomal protein S9 [Mycoplasma bradburyae]MDC4182651.1 30S ribosomal protein S9 [Mycoplasma bradburyae]MDC4183323.1 30S ribosomal protein S9 [Mycoplasma bradburyae]MDC4184131.1 30S ribosomal protein S9 [Mycoplasma bradburyae]